MPSAFYHKLMHLLVVFLTLGFEQITETPEKGRQGNLYKHIVREMDTASRLKA